MEQKILFYLLAPILMSISVSAQTGRGRIAGVVIDNTGDPLPGATIFIEELKKGSVADKKGEFSFSGVPFGTYTLTVKFTGLPNGYPKTYCGKGECTENHYQPESRSQEVGRSNDKG